MRHHFFSSTYADALRWAAYQKAALVSRASRARSCYFLRSCFRPVSSGRGALGLAWRGLPVATPQARGVAVLVIPQGVRTKRTTPSRLYDAGSWLKGRPPWPVVGGAGAACRRLRLVRAAPCGPARTGPKGVVRTAALRRLHQAGASLRACLSVGKCAYPGRYS